MQVDYHLATPDSPLASSLYHATSTIDDLTLALTNFSRVPSPEPQRQVCCCGSEECEATKVWLALKFKLESRLVLSAEVGSALLQRHEAYVRRHGVCPTCTHHDASSHPTQPSASTLRKATQGSASGDVETDRAEVDARIIELLKENAVLEKRLTQALLNNEVAEASNKTLLHELEEARSTVSKLSAYHARTMGLDNRLSAVLQENDDIRQERESQTQRAKLAETRLAALKDRTEKLQAEVRRLQDDLEIRHLQRLESSDSLLQVIRSRLEDLQVSHAAKSAVEEDSEVIKAIESLMVDNEMLNADNKELRKLLTESREDLQALQREVGEQSIAPPIWVETPSKNSRASSGLSSFAKESLLSFTRRPSSVESRSRRAYEPLTPETGRRPLSPTDSLLASVPKSTNFVHPQPQYPPFHVSLDMDNEPECDQGLSNPNQTTKAVQTDRFLALQVTSSFMDQLSISPHDGHSDSSSLPDGVGSPMSNILERMHSLLHRMTQADALTLTNRLKRQHLRGADIKHLSRTTVSNILSDISHLRAQYRVWLEDDKITTLCTRKDLRGLFKLFKEVLEEMGQMRVTLNDVILEPTIAVKVSEMALDPAKAEAMEKERKVIGLGLGASWMAPFSKLFSSSSHDTNLLSSTPRTPSRPISRGHGNIRVSRPVPKIGPALAASATTVNVEFSGTGAGKSVTSIFSAHPNNEGAHGRVPNLHPPPQPLTSMQTNVRSVMDIFAGAPHLDDASDPWVVLPRAPRRARSAFLTAEPAEIAISTIGRAAVRKRKMTLSRDVDAILDAPSAPTRSVEDSELHNIPGSLVDRTFRRRGLSDTSIHSTFMNQGGVEAENTGHPAESSGLWLERTSVLRTISRTVQNIKQVASHTISGSGHSSTSVPPHASITKPSPESSDSCLPTSSENSNIPHSQPPRLSSPALNSLIPSLTSWAAVGVALDSTHPRNTHIVHREDAGIPRRFGRESQGRDV